MTSIDRWMNFYEQIDDNWIQCNICPHRCKIKKGRASLCGVRHHTQEGLKLLNYGKAIALNLDPIEKKPLYHFYPASKIFSFGTLGCNLRCRNCQNFDISQMFDFKGRVKDYEGITHWGKDLSPEQIVRLALYHKCKMIAYTYNEPTVFFEYALETMKIAHREGLKNVWVTCGFTNDEVIDALIPYLDAVNVDIKSSRDDFYRKNSGARLAPVLNSAKKYFSKGVWVELTTLAVPTLSDDEEMFHSIAQFIKNELNEDVPWHISAFSGKISWQQKHLPDTPLETIEKGWQIGKKEGLKYVYGGNVRFEKFNNTFCNNCNELIFKRQGYLTEKRDQEGKCPKCHEQIPGRFV